MVQIKISSRTYSIALIQAIVLCCARSAIWLANVQTWIALNTSSLRTYIAVHISASKRFFVVQIQKRQSARPMPRFCCILPLRPRISAFFSKYHLLTVPVEPHCSSLPEPLFDERQMRQNRPAYMGSFTALFPFLCTSIPPLVQLVRMRFTNLLFQLPLYHQPRRIGSALGILTHSNEGMLSYSVFRFHKLGILLLRDFYAKPQITRMSELSQFNDHLITTL